MPETLTRENFAEAAHALAGQHPELRRIVDRHGLPIFWKRPERFETLVRIILEQQVSLASANTLYRRIEAEVGGVSARKFSALGAGALHELGMTRQKARYCHGLAESLVARRLSLRALRERNDDAVVAELTALPGVGPWTANTWLLLAMARADAWPPADLALRRAIAELLPDEDLETLTRTGKRWRPCRATAARLLWHYYLETRRRPG